MIASNTRAPERHRRRLPRADRGDARRRAGALPADRQVRPRRRRRRRSARSRTTSSGSPARASPTCPTARGRPTTTSTSTRRRARAWSRPGQADDRRRRDRATTSAGSHPAIKSFLNSGAGVAFSGAIAGTKTFLPEIPLNSGFYRAIDGRRRPGGHDRQRRLAHRGHRLLLRRLREDHERGLRAVVAADARARDGVLLQPRVPARRRARRAPRGPPVSSCGTTGWPAAGAAATAATGRTARRRCSASASRCSRSRARSG